MRIMNSKAQPGTIEVQGDWLTGNRYIGHDLCVIASSDLPSTRLTVELTYKIISPIKDTIYYDEQLSFI